MIPRQTKHGFLTCILLGKLFFALTGSSFSEAGTEKETEKLLQATPGFSNEKFGSGTIFDSLNLDRFVKVKLKRAVNAKIVYINKPLAIQMGYKLENLEQVLLQEYAFLIDTNTDTDTKTGTDKTSPKTKIGYADTYNAAPQKPMNQTGSGRGVFLENGVFLKGVGLTPLALWPEKNIKMLNTGFCPLYEGVKEAVFGEALNHEAKIQSTRVLTVFDLGFEDDDEKNYTRLLQQGLIVRVGEHTRFAHFLDGTFLSSFQYNVGPFRASNDWSKVKEKFPLMKTVQKLAKTQARLEFLRFWHGSVGADNLTIHGTPLDFGSVTFQTDTAPRFWLNMSAFAFFPELEKDLITSLSTFGYETHGFIEILKPLYPEFDPDVYVSEIKLQRNLRLLEAFGFSSIEASDFLSIPENSHLLNEFRTAWWELGKYFYWGKLDGRTSVEPSLSLVDIFDYLKKSSESLLVDSSAPVVELKFRSENSGEKESWHESYKSPYTSYGVTVNGCDRLQFSSIKHESRFLELKEHLPSQLNALFASFEIFWKSRNENIRGQKTKLLTQINKQTTPLIHLSRGVLLNKYKKAFQAYQAGDAQAIQRFIDSMTAEEI